MRAPKTCTCGRIVTWNVLECGTCGYEFDIDEVMEQVDEVGDVSPFRQRPHRPPRRRSFPKIKPVPQKSAQHPPTAPEPTKTLGKVKFKIRVGAACEGSDPEVEEEPEPKLEPQPEPKPETERFMVSKCPKCGRTKDLICYPTTPVTYRCPKCGVEWDYGDDDGQEK